MSTVLGLDVGASAIKAVLMEDTFKGPRIRQFYHFPYPGMNRPEAILAFFSSQAIVAERLIVSLKGYEGSVRIVDFPFNDLKKVRSVLPFELESEFADGVDSRDFRFHPILTDLRKPETQRYQFLSIGVKKALVNEFVDEFRQAGFRPMMVDYDAYANFNCFHQSDQKPEEGLSLLIDIGAKSTGINIVTPKELLYTRSVFFAGNDFTQAVSETLNLDFMESEEIKREYGLKSSETNSKIDQCLSECVDYLVREIRLTLGSFYALHGNQDIQRVYLFGGGSTLKGLSEHLSRVLGVPVEEGNPVRALNLDNVAPQSPLLFSVAIGLAMRGLGKGELKHNFLDRSFFLDAFYQKRILRHSLALFCGLLLWVMTSALEWGMSWWQLDGLRQQYQDETAAILKAQQGAYKDLNSLQLKIRERKKLLEKFAVAEKSPLWVIDFLSANLGSMDVIFEEVVLENQDDGTTLLLRGTVPGGADLGNFEKLLETVPNQRGRTRVNSGTDAQTGRYMFEERLEFRDRKK
ncbi:MAG: pilus assembly protein PilM [Candidatus Cloacimonetes bacterium]|nr:pilus assembly protein PilM [Candidatus Cloacimonadota bacterium]